MNKDCLKCNREFKVPMYRFETAKYCSRKCQNQCIRIGSKHTEETVSKISLSNLGRQLKKVCGTCKGVFMVSLSHDKQLFCSFPCYVKSKKGKPVWNKGLKLTEKHIENLVKSHTGIKMPPFSAEHRRNMSLARKGEKSHLYKGGVSLLNKALRASIEFRLWREAVFARDNWTCQDCKECGGELHPHHIKPFATFPEFRFAIDNGQTLCASCHRKTESWGRPVIINKAVSV